MPKKKVENFEQTLEKIELIVQQLESGEISLEDSIKLYKEGMELSKQCEQKLHQAQKEVSILQKNIDDSFELEDFVQSEE